MIKCPTCRRRAEPKARYCPACYTVFSSDSLAISRRGRRGTGDGVGSTAPYLFFAVILVAWFVSVDTTAWNAEPGSYAATSRDIKRKMIYWFGQSTNSLGQSLASEDREERRGVLSANERPAWSIQNDNRLPCALGTTCKIVIRFHSGNSAAYLIERPDRGAARIVAVDSRGADLMSKSNGAQLIVPEANRIPISRTTDGWTIVERLSAAGPSVGRADANEVVGV